MSQPQPEKTNPVQPEQANPPQKPTERRSKKAQRDWTPLGNVRDYFNEQIKQDSRSWR